MCHKEMQTCAREKMRAEKRVKCAPNRVLYAPEVHEAMVPEKEKRKTRAMAAAAAKAKSQNEFAGQNEMQTCTREEKEKEKTRASKRA